MELERVDRNSGVFVVAPDSVVLFFPQAKSLLADLRRMESEERDSAEFYSVEAEVLKLMPRGRGFGLVKTGVVGKDALRAALESVAGDPAAETDPRAVADHLVRSRRSPWLRRRNL